MPIRGDCRVARFLALLACVILALLPAGGLTVCLGAEHVMVGVADQRGCPCGDHGGEGAPCVDVTLVPPDCRADADGAAAWSLPPALLAPAAEVPAPLLLAAAPLPERAPCAGEGAALRRCVVLLI